MGFAAEDLAVPLSTVFVYKMGDALGRPLACTAFGWDWAYVSEHNRHGLVRTWVAQAYAFGHLLMAPHHQWAYTKSKGTHHYDPEPEEFAPLYRFVREHANLFDDYDAVTEVAVLYSSRAFRQWHRDGLGVSEWLAAQNIPFDLVLAGDDWLPVTFTADQLARYKTIIVTDDAELDTAQKAVLAEFESKTVRFSLPEDGEANLPKAAQSILASAPISVTGAEGITVVPRNRQDPAAPVVCHVLNRNYDPGSDAVTAQRDVSISLKDSLFGDRRLSEAMLHAPGPVSYTHLTLPTN